jgi:L-lactate dehydrogenase complex protein LldG
MTAQTPAAEMSKSATVERFAERVRATGALLHPCATLDEARRAVAGIVSELAETDEARGAATTSRAAVLLPDGVTPVGGEDRPSYLALGISTAVLGIAETGSLLLAPRSRWDRLVAILARVHAIAVAERDLRASLDDLPAALASSDAPYHSLVTGPTRTADIERVITIGAHGPAVLHVLLLREALPDA